MTTLLNKLKMIFSQLFEIIKRVFKCKAKETVEEIKNIFREKNLNDYFNDLMDNIGMNALSTFENDTINNETSENIKNRLDFLNKKYSNNDDMKQQIKILYDKYINFIKEYEIKSIEKKNLGNSKIMGYNVLCYNYPFYIYVDFLNPNKMNSDSLLQYTEKIFDLKSAFMAGDLARGQAIPRKASAII